MNHLMTYFVLQLAVVFFATRAGGALARRIGLPPVVGQIIAGMVVGPSLLGGITLPGFPGGLFAAAEGAIPVSPLLYGVSTIGAIILLFDSGLETDLALFVRYALKGGIVGMGGVVASFASAAWLASHFLGVTLTSPLALFMGSLSVATSVGITASILSSRKAIGSPEGTVILAAAVVDDILGIIILAVVVGIAGVAGATGGEAEAGGPIGVVRVLLIAGRAIAIWLVGTFLALRFSRGIGKSLKITFSDRSVLTVMALALTLLVAGLFEEAGLSMIIGAYVMGLSLSNTDIAYVVRSRLKTLADFFVPVFFAVSGMMVSLSALGDLRTIGFGLLFTVVAIAAKLIGSGGPALAVGFTPVGAARIGWGMVPRGEVALIIAGIGVSSGILDTSSFGVALIMTLGTTVIGPPLLNLFLRLPRPGQRKAATVSQRTETEIDFHSEEFAELVVGRFLREIEREGFLVSRLDHEDNLYQLRKDDIFISLEFSPSGKVTLTSEPSGVVFFRTALYESLLVVNEATTEMRDRFRPRDLVGSVGESTPDSTGAPPAAAAGEGGTADVPPADTPTKPQARPTFDLNPYLCEEAVRLELAGNTKEAVIDELLSLVAGFIDDPALVRKDVFDRERTMSTGMEQGIAVPHAKTAGTSRMCVAVGIAYDGIEFESLDGEPARIILLIVSPKDGYGPHLQLLATLTGLLSDAATREALLTANTPAEALAVFGVHGKKR